MNAILCAIAMWVLLQLLFVWFCTRLVEVRELDLNDYLELHAYLAGRTLESASGPLPAPHGPEFARASPSLLAEPLEEPPVRPLRATTGCAPRLQPGVAVHNGRG